MDSRIGGGDHPVGHPGRLHARQVGPAPDDGLGSVLECGDPGAGRGQQGAVDVPVDDVPAGRSLSSRDEEEVVDVPPGLHRVESLRRLFSFGTAINSPEAAGTTATYPASAKSRSTCSTPASPAWRCSTSTSQTGRCCARDGRPASTLTRGPRRRTSRKTPVGRRPRRRGAPSARSRRCVAVPSADPPCPPSRLAHAICSAPDTTGIRRCAVPAWSLSARR